MSRALRVAFIHHRDARHVRTWSGLPLFITSAIERHIGQVVDLSPAPIRLSPFHPVRGLIRLGTGKSWSYDHELVLARYYGRYFSRRVAEVEPDLTFSPAASVCLAFLDTNVPVIYYSDATWRVIQGYYPALSNLVRWTARGGEELECESSRDEFEARLNWDSWGAHVARLIDERLSHLGERIPHPRADATRA
jgi:hypothetical protein